MTPVWHLVAHASELCSPGDFVCLQREPPHSDFAVMNTEGEIVAFDNRCPHRGARIFSEPAGNREPVCRYHGRRARACDVARLRTVWVGDWLFVGPLWSHEMHPISKDSRVRAFLEATPALRPHSMLRRTYDCHWTVAVENALDIEHVPHVHRETLARLGLRRVELVTEGNGSSFERFSADAAPRLDRLQRHFPAAAAFDYAHAHAAPFAAVASTRGWTYSLQHYLPRQDGRTDFISRLFVQVNATPGAETLFSAAAAINERVFAEDAAICALVPRNAVCQFGPLDERVRHFRNTALSRMASA